MIEITDNNLYTTSYLSSLGHHCSDINESSGFCIYRERRKVKLQLTQLHFKHKISVYFFVFSVLKIAKENKKNTMQKASE
jgi:hypothetical protein